MRRRAWPAALLSIGIVAAAIGGIYGALTAWKNHVCTGLDATIGECRTATIAHAFAETFFAVGLILIVCAVIGYATDPARRPHPPRDPWQPPHQ